MTFDKLCQSERINFDISYLKTASVSGSGENVSDEL